MDRYPEQMDTRIFPLDDRDAEIMSALLLARLVATDFSMPGTGSLELRLVHAGQSFRERIRPINVTELTLAIRRVREAAAEPVR